MQSVPLFREVPINVWEQQSYPNFPQDEGYKNMSICITKEGGEQVELHIGSVVGKGGAKRALSIGADVVLLLPNNGKSRFWKKSVEEEVEMSKVCQSIGLLSPCSKKVDVQWPDSEVRIPAYTSKSFAALPAQGIYVIDVKNSESTTWKEEENELFMNPLDPFEKLRPESWDPVFRPLVEDLAKCVFFSIDAQGDDTVNFAVVRTRNYPGYEVRVFCFDFSSPSQYPRQIPLIENFKTALAQKLLPAFDEETTRKYLNEKVGNVLSELFSVEFGDAFYPNRRREVTDLFSALQEKYTNQVWERLQQMLHGQVDQEELFHGQLPVGSAKDLSRYVDYKKAERFPHLNQKDAYYEDLDIVLRRGNQQPVATKSVGTLGKGGAKRAVQLKSGEVLLLPNNHKVWFWQKSVKEEVEMANVCERIGLLTPGAEPVRVKVGNYDIAIPAYISKSFASFASQGIFVIDVKNSDTSTWKEGEHALFQGEEEKLKRENWNKVCEPLLLDLAKSIFYRIDASGSSTINVAIKMRKDADSPEYRARVFAFDFSSPSALARPIPMVENIQANPTQAKTEEESTRAYLKETLTVVLESLFIVEFGEKYYRPNDQMRTLHSLLRSLRDDYTEKVLALLNQMTG